MLKSHFFKFRKDFELNRTLPGDEKANCAPALALRASAPAAAAAALQIFPEGLEKVTDWPSQMEFSRAMALALQGPTGSMPTFLVSRCLPLVSPPLGPVGLAWRSN